MPSHPTTLMAEDEAGMQALLEDMLRRPGYQVLTATTVPEAEAARQRLGPGSLDLVIANIYLTGGPGAREGYPVSQRWRAWQPGPPFPLISGHPPPEISQPFASGRCGGRPNPSPLGSSSRWCGRPSVAEGGPLARAGAPSVARMTGGQ